MRKLKLSVDDLSVQSFSTVGLEVKPGTVRANEGTEVAYCTGQGICQTQACTDYGQTYCVVYVSYEFFSCVFSDCGGHSCDDQCHPSEGCQSGTCYTNCGQDTCVGTCPVDTCPQ